MKTALLALFVLLKEPLTRMLSSLKFWTAIVGMSSTYLAHKGIVLDPQMAQYVAGFFALVLAGQGLQDHGKAKAQIEADASTARPPQSGRARFETLLAIVMLGLLATQTCGCGPSTREVALKTTFVAAKTAQVGFVAWDKEHQHQLAAAATSLPAGEAELAAYTKQRTPVAAAFEGVYRAIAAAAVLEQDHASLTAALTAWEQLSRSLTLLTGGQLP